MANLASDWSGDRIEMFFESLFERGHGSLKVIRKHDLFILKGSVSEMTFTINQFQSAASEIECLIER